MNTSRTFSSLFLTLLCLCLSFQVFAEEGCNLSDTSGSPIQKWQENINSLNTAIRSKSGSSQCNVGVSTSDSAFSSYVAQVLPLNSSVAMMYDIYSLSTLGTDFFSEVDSFMDQAWPVRELEPHLSSIEEIERSIIETAQYAGSRCAQSMILDEDILAGKSSYVTQWRSVSDVLIAMAKQTKEAKRFFQILSQWIQTEEYIDEVPFSIAPTWFSKEMYVYYSPKHIQECRDNDPRKWAFMDVIKWAFTSGWKYPQALQIWKDAMALLLYRGSQLTGSGTSDASKDAQINNVVQARKGGLGNSDIMINGQFFKEFGYRPNSKSTTEKVETQEKRAFYETMGYEFIREVLPSIVSQSWKNDTSFVKNTQFVEEAEKIQRRQDIDESNRDWYIFQNGRIGDTSKSNDPKVSSDLVNIISGSKERQTTLEKAKELADKIFRKQANNIK